jgi:hypothetical protein
MKVCVLSENHFSNRHVGWSVSHNLEAALVDTFNAEVLYPCLNKTVQINNWTLPDTAIAPMRGWRHRLFKSWYDLDRLPSLDPDLNVLLIIGLNPAFLLSMHALGEQLQQFDVKIGYVLDGFNPQYIDRAAIFHLDHLFVISPEIAAAVSAAHPQLSVSCLPIGIDTSMVRSNYGGRSIDILGYGRCNDILHRQLIRRFNSRESDRIYFYSTFAEPDVFDLDEHTRLQSQILSQSKISLCFEASHIPRFFGHSPLLYRWVEAWAHGCVVVGKKPLGQGVAELMNWQDSTIELPDQPTDWLPFLEALLADQDRLAEVSLRNYQQALLMHDWRDRFRQMLVMTGLPIPMQLQETIYHLQQQAGQHRSLNDLSSPSVGKVEQTALPV